jgi:PAS domain S-box-containing protein
VLDCIITMDADGRVIEFNAAAERTFSHTKTDAIERALTDSIIPPLLRDVPVILISVNPSTDHMREGC